MKVIYAYKEGAKIEYIPTGGGYQRILLWFEDNGDWFVFFTDDLLSRVYLHRVVDKLKQPHEIFSGFNLETLNEEEFNTYYKWIHNNYNYQGLHKGEKIDG